MDSEPSSVRGASGPPVGQTFNEHSRVNPQDSAPTPGRGDQPPEGPSSPSQPQNLAPEEGGPDDGATPQILPETDRNGSTYHNPERTQATPPMHGAQNNNGQPKLKIKTTRATLTLASLNIRGGGSNSTASKWQNVNQILRDKRIGVLAIQETHLKDETIDNLHAQFSARMHIRNSNDGLETSSKGIAFVLNKQLTAWKEAKTTEVVPGRALLLNLPWQKTSTITILAIYAPNQPTQNSDFWRTLAEKWQENRLPKPDVLLGDFNMVEEAHDRLPPHADSAQAVTNLNALKEMFTLGDGWRKYHGNTLAYSYKQTATQARSRIDRIYITDDMYKSSQDWQIDSSGIRTDHYLVSVKVANPRAPFIGRGRWAIPPFAIENRKIIQLILEKGFDMQTDMEEMENKERDRRVKGDVQRRFHTFKTEITTLVRNYTRTEVPKMEARIRKAKEDLKTTLNEANTNIHLRQMGAEALENLIDDLESQRHTKIRDNNAIKHKLEGECLTKYWININKEKTPRDTIHRMKYPTMDLDEGEERYTTRSSEMAEIARNYHNQLQFQDLTDELQEDQVEPILSKLDTSLTNTEKVQLAEYITEEEIETAIANLPLGKAPGPDGIPHELWKKLAKRHNDDLRADRRALNIVRILRYVYNDIERNGADDTTHFSSGWMCPIYKKGDISEIANYRPITVLNSDYKIMTRVLTTRLSNVATGLIHPDQAGFMKGRRIEDQTDLAQLMIDRCEAYEENGAIICLDQEKAYDKIRHDFIWWTLKKLNFPKHFIDTVKSLYSQGKTCVIINGVISDYYQVIRGVRQGDPLSCLIFNMAIESLASLLRKSELSGFHIPGNNEPLITTLFADDTTVYLRESDEYNTLRELLDKWCRVSGAKFNVPKTVVIPIGSDQYRQTLITTRKLSAEQSTIPENVRIANDGETTRILGAHVGNKTNQQGVWTPTLEKLDKRLTNWLKGHPTQNGKRLVIGMEAGGLTQYLTRVQGMPKPVAEQIKRKISKFFWNGEHPTVNIQTLGEPGLKGGKDVLNIEIRNDAIDLMRLQAYLKPRNKRPRWAFVADDLIKKHILHHPHKVQEESVRNIFMQSWKTRTRGETALPEPLQRLIKVAKKHNVGVSDPRPTKDQVGEMPIWHHIGTKPNEKQRNNTVWADCQRSNHGIKTVIDMVEYTEIEMPPEHEENAYCECIQCATSRTAGCTNPHKCRAAGLTTLNQLMPCWDPRQLTNQPLPYMHEEDEFDKMPERSENLEESYRAFRGEMNPQLNDEMRLGEEGGEPAELSIFIHSHVRNRGGDNQTAYASIFYAEGDERNCTTIARGPVKTKQAAEVTAILHILNEAHSKDNITLYFEGKSTPKLLLTRHREWDRRGWIIHPNGLRIRAVVNKIQNRKGRTKLKTADTSDSPGMQGAKILTETALSNVPYGVTEVNVEPAPDMGANLQSLTQALFYKMIHIKKDHVPERRAAKVHLDIIRHAIGEINGNRPNDETIWKAIKNPVYTHRHKAFLWRVIHDSYKIGAYWETIPNYEQRGICSTCNVTESMDHILTECQASSQNTIWRECERVWNLRATPDPMPEWHRPSLGVILGSSLPIFRTNDQKPMVGASRLYTILVSESAQLIWRLRCKWKISDSSDPNKKPTDDAVIKAWKTTINRRINLETLLTNTFKYGHKALKYSLVDKTWRGVLKDGRHVQDDWISSHRGLVGIG